MIQHAAYNLLFGLDFPFPAGASVKGTGHEVVVQVRNAYVYVVGEPTESLVKVVGHIIGAAGMVGGVVSSPSPARSP